MAVAAEDAAQNTMVLVACVARGNAVEGFCPRLLVGVLFALVDLLLELFRLLLVGKAESSQAVFELEGVEEDAVLVVVPCVVDLLVPYDEAVTAGLG